MRKNYIIEVRLSEEEKKKIEVLKEH